MYRFVLPSLILIVSLPAFDSPAVELGREQIATGFTSPVFMTAPPGDTTRLFVVEQGGVIKIIDLSDNSVSGTPFLNITSAVESTGNEQGLLGMAFHPDYISNGFFYLYYTHEPGGGPDVSRIVRYTANSPFESSNTADEDSEVILLSFDQPQSNHNGGMIAFEPRGDGKDYLYIATGDGGSSCDCGSGHTTDIGNAQDLTKYLGKMLRIDVNEDGEGSGTGGDNYDIPPSNPWAGGSSPLPEIWAYGLRNPYRFSFDRDTGALYIADVGQFELEEIDFQLESSSGGENYGWRIKEGPDLLAASGGCGNCFAPTGDPGGLTDPIHFYANDGGFAIIGGYPYRGAAIPFFEGHYIYGDISGIARSLFVDSGSATLHQDWATPLQTGNISSFGEDANGELYFAIRPFPVTNNGTVYKIVPTDNDIVWVDFGATGILKGSQLNPLSLLEVAVRSVVDGGQINIDSNSMVTTSNEQFIIDRAMTITAVNGPVSIGAAARNARTSDEGFVSRP